jgi:predicted TIM-barrel fold metal-dependent hydrolase
LNNRGRQTIEECMASTPFDEPILDPDLPIIDPHHHVWMLPDAMLDALDTIEDPDGKTIARTFRLHSKYLLDELLADLHAGHNMVATVFAEAHTMYRATGPEHLRSVGEVEFVNGFGAIADSGVFGPTRFCAGIIGSADLRMGDAVREVLEAHLQAGGGRYRGIRQPGAAYDARLTGLHHVMGSPGVLLDPSLLVGARHLQELGLSLDLFVLDTQLDDSLHVARNLPETTIVLNHTGGPLGIGPYAADRSEHFRAWRRGMERMAECGNVVVKVGGLGMPLCGFPTSALAERAGSEALAHDWRPFIETAIELFGTDRDLSSHLEHLQARRQRCIAGGETGALQRDCCAHLQHHHTSLTGSPEGERGRQVSGKRGE